MQSAWTVANANGAGANAPTNGYKSTTLCSQMQYRMSHHVGHIAWLTHEFEMYTTFDPLTQKVSRPRSPLSWLLKTRYVRGWLILRADMAVPVEERLTRCGA
eukprot:scaffold886_cov317-Prasinococcus_capsulatus_cf.AAC.11